MSSLKDKIMGCDKYNKTLHLSCCIGVDCDNILIPYFLNHYKNMGVNNFIIILHTYKKDENMDRSISYLNHFGIKNICIWEGIWDGIVKEKKLREKEKKEVKCGEWIITADIDEFHTYKNYKNARHLIGKCDRLGYNCVGGVLIDRLSADGSINKIDPELSLWSQFPIKSFVTKDILKAEYKKAMLYKKGIIPIAQGHHGISIKSDLKPKIYPHPFEVHHFKWFHGIEEKMGNRKNLLKLKNQNWWKESERFLEYFSKNNNKFEITEQWKNKK